MKNYYQVLHVRNFASDREIKKSFRQLAKKYHPDKNKGRNDFQEKFIEIVNAYEVLTNPIIKKDFDSKLLTEIRRTVLTGESTNDDNSILNLQTDIRNQFLGKVGVGRVITIGITLIVILSLFLLYHWNSDTKTTTGSPKADKELEKEESAKNPQTGEIDFNK